MPQQHPAAMRQTPPASALFDDDFVMSLKLGADYRTLQRQAAAAAGAGAAAEGAARPPSAASSRGEGRSEAIDRLKGLRCVQGLALLVCTVVSH